MCPWCDEMVVGQLPTTDPTLTSLAGDYKATLRCHPTPFSSTYDFNDPTNPNFYLKCLV